MNNQPHQLLITNGVGFIGTNFERYWCSAYLGDRIVVLDGGEISDRALEGSIALRKYIRTMFKCSIDTIMKVVKFVPPLPHPVFEYKPPMLDLV